MKILNFNVAICKEFDEVTKSVREFVNEIEMENNKADVTFLTLMGGYGEIIEELSFDYFLVCLRPKEEHQYKGKGSFLFRMEMEKKVENNNENSEKQLCSSMGVGAFQEITSYKRIVTFPCEGNYELRVYNASKMESKVPPKLRFKEYNEKALNPVSFCSFYVK